MISNIADSLLPLGNALSSASQDGELHPPSSTIYGLGGTIVSDMLSGGKMECSSCHNVHNESDEDNLLIKSNATSALCLTCHNK